MIAKQSLVHALGIVQHRDVDIGVENLQLIEIKSREQPMPPAEGGVGVNQHVLVLIGDAKNFLEHRPAKRVKPGDRQIENPPGWYIRRFGVHHLPDVADHQIMPGL